MSNDPLSDKVQALAIAARHAEYMRVMGEEPTWQSLAPLDKLPSGKDWDDFQTRWQKSKGEVLENSPSKTTLNERLDTLKPPSSLRQHVEAVIDNAAEAFFAVILEKETLRGDNVRYHKCGAMIEALCGSTYDAFRVCGLTHERSKEFVGSVFGRINRTVIPSLREGRGCEMTTRGYEAVERAKQGENKLAMNMLFPSKSESKSR